MTRTTSRRAVTLTEVLIAIFLMGIGLMAILSLFPLGASQMAQALKDQRCAEAATNADALSRIIWKQTCDADTNSGSLKFSDAIKYSDVSYLEVLSKGLGVMDATSIAMCRDNRLPILVFNLNTPGNIMRMAQGESVGTVIR